MLVIPAFVDIGISLREAANIYGGFVGIKRLISWPWFMVTEIHAEETKCFSVTIASKVQLALEYLLII